MQLRQLEYLVTIWDAGSFSAAAAQLYQSQPSLSQQIRALEKELGLELFERGRHGLSLTPAGRALLPHARRVLEAAREAVDAVRQVAEGRSGDVQVLTVRSVASGVLPPSAARWHAGHPGTMLRLHDFSHRRELEAATRGGYGDLSIGPRPPEWDGPVVSLGYEELVVVGSGEYDQRVPADTDELAAADWVLYEPEQGMSEVVDWLAAVLGFVPRAVARTGQVAAALSFAVEGSGITLAPGNAVPGGWIRHTRRIGPGVFREIVAYSRREPTGAVAEYRDLLLSVGLPLTRGDELPAGAVRC
ncbi:LysR family transcriptional regulator [Nocardia otitidiscaviarum]|uniref:LysR family transcriptional regulator n=1 Tax=Nocardia otitidiscaviarum TaxID=1823 RepID=UPI001894DC79|nr:LysR family transcriptional regulator [Nocardia otitidiscaviarum]MBF6180041.1 LysR family transcriptional regulator [Nocardia otitidiscaviarum]